MKVGIIGTGAMGSRVAKNLIDAGYEVHIYNRSSERAQPLLALGAFWHESARQCTEAVDVVISMVTDDAASREVWLAPERGAKYGMDETTIAIESSTISHGWSQVLAKELVEKRFLIAPMVGSRPQVEAKLLTFLVGGEKDLFAKVESLLLTTSAKVLYVGDHSKALVLKLVINSLFGIQTAAFAEMFIGLEKSGFSKEQIMMILPNLPITAPIMQMMLNLFAEEDFSPQFPVRLVEKDFGYAKTWLEELGNSFFVTKAVQEVYLKAIEKGLGDKNISGVLEFYQK